MRLIDEISLHWQPKKRKMRVQPKRKTKVPPKGRT